MTSTDSRTAAFADKVRADTAREAAEITAIVLRETADRFEQECPDADGEFDLCMCHAAPVLRRWADEAQYGDEAEMAASLRRDGFGDDEIADMLRAPAPGSVVSAAADKTEACGKCRRPFDPADTRFDGHARHRETPWCRSCVDLCHDSSDAFHRCVICDTYETGE